MKSYSHRAYIEAKASSIRGSRVLSDTWHLEQLLGLGRGTAVYSATHREGSSAAIKLIANEHEHAADPAPVLAGLAALASAWAHPAAVPCHDAGISSDGSLYLVMDLLDGETLLQHVQRVNAPVQPAYAVRIVARLLEVLAVAHRNQIFHQALNLNNVFIERSGELRLLDLGLAQLLERAAPRLAARCGYALGTPGFMPPEQALGLVHEVDAATDVWAVGAILFRLLTGSLVHGHDPKPAAQALSAAGRFAPKLASVLSGATPELCLLVDRALAFNKRDRWFDAQAMHSALLRLFGAQRPRLGDQPLSLPVTFHDRSGNAVRGDEITQV